MDTSPPAPPAAPPPAPSLLTAWPRSAQLTTAFLAGVCATLLGVQLWSSMRWSSRPAELERTTYRIDLNRATRAELLQVPGVGNSLAERIEDHRREHGPFRNVDQVVDVPGVGPATVERLRPWVYVRSDDAPPREAFPTPPATAPLVKRTASGGAKKAPPNGPVDVNRATVEELQKLPNIGPKRAQNIVEERAKGRFKSVDDLRRVPGIGPKTLDQLRPHVTVGTDSVVAAENTPPQPGE